jgi:hypothetical protein
VLLELQHCQRFSITYRSAEFHSAALRVNLVLQTAE